MSRVVFVMGVSGSGKSTVGSALSKELNISFFDGDDYHPKSNIDKMSNGIPLNDQDRFGWLVTLNELAKEHLIQHGCIIVCSALKESYRALLSKGIEDKVSWVYLKGSKELLLERLNNREDHFMSSNLLQSQLDTLEEPDNALVYNISEPVEIIVKKIGKELI